ncbi:MAG TPA: S24 family peptidase [Smithellaceae bacterium]|nr:S24 family peptidase [Smithellaceae bacterium]
MKTKRTIQSVTQSIADFNRERRRMPTYEEMMSLLAVRSKSVVHFWMNKLLQEGILEKDPSGRLTLIHPFVGVPLAGGVSAGFPSPAEEELRDVISFDDYLITNHAESFLLKVDGDSMTGAGILPDDLVLVERGREPKSGDIVIAEVDGAWTMKYFHKNGREVYLEAANPKYPRITPVTEMRLGGVVTAVVRKYVP